MMRTFVKLFGPYPWRQYSQLVASEYTWGGMENTGATTLTEKGLMDSRAAMDLTYDGLLSHELAHQWWGDLVTCHGWHHNWLNEGWATFCEALFNEARDGEDAGAWTRLKNTNQYWTQDRGQYRRPIVFDRYGENRGTGSFILIDPATQFTCGAGMIVEPIRESAPTHAAPLTFAERLAHLARRAASDEEAAEAVRQALEEMLT